MSQHSDSTEIIEIIITGLPQTGKTTFIRSLCSTVHVDGDGEGWHYGALPIDKELTVHFVEPPQMKHFDFLWMRELIASAEVAGYICLFDSVDTRLFGESVAILETIRSEHPGMPLAVAANRQDLAGAWTPDDIRMGLGIPDDIPVLPCIANKQSLVREIVIELLYRIFEN